MSNYAYPPRMHIDFTHIINTSCHLVIGVIFKMHKQNAKFRVDLHTNPTGPTRSHTYTALQILKTTQGKLSVHRRAFEGKHIDNHKNFAVTPNFQIELQAAVLKHFEELNRFLIETRLVPLTRSAALVRCLARYPIVSIRQLAENAQVAEVTARRWLNILVKNHLMTKEFFGGQNQFLNTDYLALIDTQAKRALGTNAVIDSRSR